jgi:Protein of unknown function (DUF2384)
MMMSDLSDRLARIRACVQETFGSQCKAETSLERPHRVLGAAKPIALAATEEGAAAWRRSAASITASSSRSRLLAAFDRRIGNFLGGWRLHQI